MTRQCSEPHPWGMRYPSRQPYKTVWLALFLAGCGGMQVDQPVAMTSDEAVAPAPGNIDPWREAPAPARSGEATAAIVAYLGIIGSPEIHWYGGAGLDCGDPNIVGWIVTGSSPPRCDGGQERGSNLITVATMPGFPISSGSLAHELGHMRAWELSGGDNDTGHLMTGIFGPGGEVYRVNAMLSSAGM